MQKHNYRRDETAVWPFPRLRLNGPIPAACRWGARREETNISPTLGKTHLSRREWRHSRLFLIGDPEKRVMKERRVIVLCTLAVGRGSARRHPMIDGPPRPSACWVGKFISETGWMMHIGLLEEEPVSTFLCGKIKAKHFISPEWPSRASTPPPSNQIYRSLHPALASLHQRIWPPRCDERRTPRRFIEVTGFCSCHVSRRAPENVMFKCRKKRKCHLDQDVRCRGWI